MPTPRLKVSGIHRLDDPSPRIRIEAGSPYVFLDREDIQALVEMINAPPPPPPLFSIEEQRRIATEAGQRRQREAAAIEASRAAEEADFRTRYPELSKQLLPEPRTGGDLRVNSVPIKE